MSIDTNNNVQEKDEKADTVNLDSNPKDNTKDEVKDDNKGGLDDDDKGGHNNDSVKLISSDRQEFEIDKKSASLSAFLGAILEGHTENNTIDIPQVSGEYLKIAVEYLKEHKGIEPEPIPMPVRSTQMTGVTPYEWDGIFIDRFRPADVFEIILAANYLDIKPLLHLGCAKIATEIKKLPREEINRIIEDEEKYRKEQNESTQNLDGD